MKGLNHEYLRKVIIWLPMQRISCIAVFIKYSSKAWLFFWKYRKNQRGIEETSEMKCSNGVSYRTSFVRVQTFGRRNNIRKSENIYLLNDVTFLFTCLFNINYRDIRLNSRLEVIMRYP